MGQRSYLLRELKAVGSIGITMKTWNGLLLNASKEVRLPFRSSLFDLLCVDEIVRVDLVLIHGSVIHRSERNLSDDSRFIYTFHCIEGKSQGVEWDEKNWSVDSAV